MHVNCIDILHHLTNAEDCLKRGFIQEDEIHIEKAAQRLIVDKFNVIYTIGGDETYTKAAILSDHTQKQRGGKVVVIGMPKTIDNNVFPA